jgi:hypothetical protein
MESRSSKVAQRHEHLERKKRLRSLEESGKEEDSSRALKKPRIAFPDLIELIPTAFAGSDSSSSRTGMIFPSFSLGTSFSLSSDDFFLLSVNLDQRSK